MIFKEILLISLYLIHSVDNPFDINDITDLIPSKLENAEYQFPGVFFSLITKNNIHNEPLFSNDNILIFSKKLLEQKNYHINIRDYNGWINETNTFFSWELNKAVNIINNIDNEIGNEVVFHDSISMKYLVSYIKSGSNKDLPDNIDSINIPEPDMSKIPFYCIPFENNYNGIEKLKISSKEFYIKMAKMCLIEKTEEKTIEEIIELIKMNINKFYNNRELLDINQMYI
jgi:hypothetical protein